MSTGRFKIKIRWDLESLWKSYMLLQEGLRLVIRVLRVWLEVKIGEIRAGLKVRGLLYGIKVWKLVLEVLQADLVDNDWAVAGRLGGKWVECYMRYFSGEKQLSRYSLNEPGNQTSQCWIIELATDSTDQWAWTESPLYWPYYCFERWRPVYCIHLRSK